VSLGETIIRRVPEPFRSFALKHTVLTDKPIVSKVIATTIATIVSYILNREWSFRTRGGRVRHHEAALFFLISGIGIALKALSPSTRIVGVEVAASSPFTASLAAGRLVTIDVRPSLADGLTGNLDPDTITLDIVRDVVDEIVVVGEDDLRRALAGVLTHEHLVIEGAAAAGPAALLSGRVHARGNVAVILSGANIDRDRLLGVVSAA